ncbi:MULTISPECIES: acyl carrier protein [Bradyrhizobium]|uniref:acyl carrier protein n=1 Tax=Bradyrhizobium TaxID=374 RepID=UPI0015969BF0|nr:acyl carrier protein [Bradyrhizobium septentrionale]UGY22035.1 acyl carrier protein [Bradyrhizobium septentrionale]
MTYEATMDRLLPIFRDVFDNDEIVLGPELTASQVEGWDSLGHVRLIVAIEQALDITLSTVEITGLENVGQLAGLIDRKLGKGKK